MEVDVIVTKDLKVSIRIALTPAERNEYGDLANSVADEVIKDIAKQMNLDTDMLSFNTEKEPERHVQVGKIDARNLQNKTHLDFKH